MLPNIFRLIGSVKVPISPAAAAGVVVEWDTVSGSWLVLRFNSHKFANADTHTESTAHSALDDESDRRVPQLLPDGWDYLPQFFSSVQPIT